MISLTLPWPPTVNTYWRHTIVDGQLRTLISRRGKSYRFDVYAAWLVSAQRMASAITEPVRVTIAAYPPDRRQRDLDNLPKAVFDALTHVGVWKDDSQVDEFSIKRCEVGKPGKLVVDIEEIID